MPSVQSVGCEPAVKGGVDEISYIARIDCLASARLGTGGRAGAREVLLPFVLVGVQAHVDGGLQCIGRWCAAGVATSAKSCPQAEGSPAFHPQS